MAEKRIPTAVYCRASDNRHDFENQIGWVEAFLIDHPELEHCKTFIDNKETLKAWNELVQSCEGGAIELVLIRDAEIITTDEDQLFEEMKSFPALVFGVADGFSSDAILQLKDVLPVFKSPEEVFLDIQRRILNGEKISQSLKEKKERGESVGNIAYGYKKKGSGIVIDPETAAIVEEIFLKARDGIKPQVIADYLDSMQIPTPKGGSHWTDDTIRVILTNPVYFGEDPIANYHSAIVTRELFNQVREVLEGSGRSRRENAEANKATIAEDQDVLKGIFICAVCGERLTYQRADAKYRRKASYYCRYHTGANPKGQKLDKKPSIDAVQIKQEVLDRSNKFIEKINFVLDHLSVPMPWLDTSVLEGRIQTLGELQNNLRDQFANSVIDDEEFKKRKNQNRESYKGLYREIIDIRHRKAVVEVLGAILRQRYEPDRPQKMDTFDNATGRRIISRLKLKADGTYHLEFNEEYIIDYELIPELQKAVSG